MTQENITRMAREAGLEGMTAYKPKEWVTFNHLTHTYDTPDGTAVPAEICDDVRCLADILKIATIREKQRNAIRARGQA